LLPGHWEGGCGCGNHVGSKCLRIPGGNLHPSDSCHLPPGDGGSRRRCVPKGKSASRAPRRRTKASSRRRRRAGTSHPTTSASMAASTVRGDAEKRSRPPHHHIRSTPPPSAGRGGLEVPRANPNSRWKIQPVFGSFPLQVRTLKGRRKSVFGRKNATCSMRDVG